VKGVRKNYENAITNWKIKIKA